MNALIHGVLFASVSVGVCGVLLRVFRTWLTPAWQHRILLVMAVRLLLPIPAPWPEIAIPHASVIAALWLVAACALFATSLLKTLRLRRRVIDAETTPPDFLHATFVAARDGLQLRQRPLLISTNTAVAPLLCGLWQPLVAIPDVVLNNWSPEHIRLILLHELSHLKHLDIGLSWLWQAGFSCHFFNPFVHLFKRDFAEARELRCDANAIRSLSESERVAYGRTLFELGQVCHRPALCHGGVACVVEEKSTLEKRIESILHPRRHSSSSLPALAMIVLLVVSLLPILRAAEQPKNKTPEVVVQTFLNATASRDPVAIRQCLTPEFADSIAEMIDDIANRPPPDKSVTLLDKPPLINGDSAEVFIAEGNDAGSLSLRQVNGQWLIDGPPGFRKPPKAQPQIHPFVERAAIAVGNYVTNELAKDMEAIVTSLNKEDTYYELAEESAPSSSFDGDYNTDINGNAPKDIALMFRNAVNKGNEATIRRCLAPDYAATFADLKSFPRRPASSTSSFISVTGGNAKVVLKSRNQTDTYLLRQIDSQWRITAIQ